MYSSRARRNTRKAYRSREMMLVLLSELIFRVGPSSSRDVERESRSSELMVIDSRERGEPPPLCADDVDEYGEGGRSCVCADIASSDGESLARECGGGERDVRRRLRIGWLEDEGRVLLSWLSSGLEDAECVR